jgi:hypothetical protein
MKEIHNTKIEDEMEQIYADIVKFLKKEYKLITKESLSLTPDGPCDVLMQNMSKIRTWVQCSKVYTIGGMNDVIAGGLPSEDKLDSAVKKWLELGRDSAKKPENITRKND